MSKKPDHVSAGVRNSGTLYRADGTREVGIETVEPAVGYGRWVYCKYCYKNVRPAISHPSESERGKHGLPRSEQLICAECGYGLAPPVWLEPADSLQRRRGIAMSGPANDEEEDLLYDFPPGYMPADEREAMRQQRERRRRMERERGAAKKAKADQWNALFGGLDLSQRAHIQTLRWDGDGGHPELWIECPDRETGWAKLIGILANVAEALGVAVPESDAPVELSARALKREFMALSVERGRERLLAKTAVANQWDLLLAALNINLRAYVQTVHWDGPDDPQPEIWIGDPITARSSEADWDRVVAILAQHAPHA